MTGPELLELEHQLNHYWLGTLPERTACFTIGRAAFDYRKSLLSVSVLFKVTHPSHQEGDELMKMKGDGALVTLRNKSNPWGFEPC